MKLQTMLLPTGEFILVGSNCKQPHPTAQLLDGLKAAIGAAAVLIVEQDVQVEDALVDESAIRVEPPELADAKDYFRKTYIPNARMRDGQAMRLEFTTDIRPGDEQLINAYFGGADFSPAGLVKSTRDQSVQEFAAQGNIDVGGARTDISAEHVGQELVDAVYESEPLLDSQTVTSVRTSEDGRTIFEQNEPEGQFGRSPYTGPKDHVLEADSLTISTTEDEPKKTKPEIGDSAEILEVAGGNRAPYNGYVGWVGTIEKIEPWGYARVRLDDSDAIWVQEWCAPAVEMPRLFQSGTLRESKNTDRGSAWRIDLHDEHLGASPLYLDGQFELVKRVGEHRG